MAISALTLLRNHHRHPALELLHLPRQTPCTPYPPSPVLPTLSPTFRLPGLAALDAARRWNQSLGPCVSSAFHSACALEVHWGCSTWPNFLFKAEDDSLLHVDHHAHPFLHAWMLGVFPALGSWEHGRTRLCLNPCFRPVGYVPRDGAAALHGSPICNCSEEPPTVLVSTATAPFLVPPAIGHLKGKGPQSPCWPCWSGQAPLHRSGHLWDLPRSRCAGTKTV